LLDDQLYLLQVIRTRLTADTTGQYSNVASAFQRIMQHEGKRGLYRGLLPSVAAIIPEAAITCVHWLSVRLWIVLLKRNLILEPVPFVVSLSLRNA